LGIPGPKRAKHPSRARRVPRRCSGQQRVKRRGIYGMLEPFFRDNATQWVVALRDAGADVVMSERVASHGEALWRGEFLLMVAWAFGR
jgi:hypothetical protein